MERAEWLLLMNITCKLQAVSGGFAGHPSTSRNSLEIKAVLPFSVVAEL
jgi:hypothetical protein